MCKVTNFLNKEFYTYKVLFSFAMKILLLNLYIRMLYLFTYKDVNLLSMYTKWYIFVFKQFTYKENNLRKNRYNWKQLMSWVQITNNSFKLEQ